MNPQNEALGATRNDDLGAARPVVPPVSHHACDCPLCMAGSDGPICDPCWRVITDQRAWSDAYWSVTAAMQALATLGSAQATDALERLDVWRCEVLEQVLGEPGAMERPR